MMTAEERLDRIEAHIAIADLIHEYARLVRRDMPEGVADLFAPDGWFEIRDGHPDKAEHNVREHLASPQAIRDYLIPGKGKPHPVPLIRNMMIEVTGDQISGYRGLANSVMDGQIYRTEIKVQGEYADSFRQVGGRWLFASRTFTIYRGGSSV